MRFRITQAGGDRRGEIGEHGPVWDTALELLEQDLIRRDAAPRTGAPTGGPEQFADWAARAGLARRTSARGTCAATWRPCPAAAAPRARPRASSPRCARCSRASASTARSPRVRPTWCPTPRRRRTAARAQRARGGGACSTSIPADGPLELRDRAMFELAYSCGLRAEELVSLRIERPRPRRRAAARRGQGSQDPLRARRRAGAGGRLRLPGARPPRLADRSATRSDRAGRRTRTARARADAAGALFLSKTGRRAGHQRRAPAAARLGARAGIESAAAAITRTRCATASPPTCSTAAPICASSRSCSATRASRAPRFTLG